MHTWTWSCISNDWTVFGQTHGKCSRVLLFRKYGCYGEEAQKKTPEISDLETLSWYFHLDHGACICQWIFCDFFQSMFNILILSATMTSCTDEFPNILAGKKPSFVVAVSLLTRSYSENSLGSQKWVGNPLLEWGADLLHLVTSWNTDRFRERGNWKAAPEFICSGLVSHPFASR